MVFELDSGERRTIAFKTGVQQGDALGPALFCMPVGITMHSTREAFGELGVDIMDDIYLTSTPPPPVPSRIWAVS